MFVGMNQLGSMVIDIDGKRLDAKFLRETGAVDDHFTIIKSTGPSPLRLATVLLADGTVNAQWNSIASHQYRLEMALDLEAPVWTPVSPVMTATGTTMRWSGSIDQPGEKYFFRVADLGP